MNLVFVGDIALDRVPESLGIPSPLFREASLVLANLEGGILRDEDRDQMPASGTLGLYNTIDVLQVLKAFHVGVVFLANNHIFDLPFPVKETRTTLSEAGIASFGAGNSLAEAQRAFSVTADGTMVKLFSFGWEVIGCPPARDNRPGVNPLTPEHVLQTIRQLRATDQASFVVFIMHWNYELERYPQPAHRQLAHDLISEGVDAIVGLHSHVVQGAELVGGKPVVYSLGNWFFPVRQLGHLHLAFPPVSRRQLALELVIGDERECDVRFHWHSFDPEQSRIDHEQTEDWDGTILHDLSPFAGMGHDEYVSWFRSHRTRKRMLPIYTDYRHTARNRIKDSYVSLRQRAIRSLVSIGLKERLTSGHSQAQN